MCALRCPYIGLYIEIYLEVQEHYTFNIFFNIHGYTITRHAYYVLTKTAYRISSDPKRRSLFRFNYNYMISFFLDETEENIISRIDFT